jgi:hypothetical protein
MTKQEVEVVAKAIASDRMSRDTPAEAIAIVGGKKAFAELHAKSFAKLWDGKTEVDKRQRAAYRRDARVAISTLDKIRKLSKGEN